MLTTKKQVEFKKWMQLKEKNYIFAVISRISDKYLSYFTYFKKKEKISSKVVGETTFVSTNKK
jgi:hypothetical protein